MSNQHVGRHRSPGFNPLSELALIASESAKPAARASAVVVASTGMVASFSLPAGAAGGNEIVKAPAAPSSVSVALAVAAPSTAEGEEYGEVAFKASKAKAKKVRAVKIELVAVPEVEAEAATTGRSTTRSTSRGTARPAPRNIPASAPTGGLFGVAASLLSIPYRYGGTTTAGFDCSGFTGYVFRKVGVSLPRTAEQQRRATTRVSNPAPGDLVFFGIPAYHVGIYAGGGKMYDSGSSGGSVQYRSIWTSNVTYGRA